LRKSVHAHGRVPKRVKGIGLEHGVRLRSREMRAWFRP
jgi:hypothetical protein